MTQNRVRPLCLTALAIVGAALTACGGSSPPPPAPGSPERPLVAEQTRLGGTAPDGRSNEGAAAPSQAKPSYDALVRKQPRHPRNRFTPCNLVTAAQATRIVGAPIQEPIEARQGPTCIYRSRDGKRFVTVAVQASDFKKIKPRLRLARRVEVSNRAAYCGTYGQPMLYVPLSRGRVLSVAAQCSIAKRFAIRAVRQLSA